MPVQSSGVHETLCVTNPAKHVI
eukprot:COSAG02_NODE_62045_length_267_cov_0.601190_1_plen_22_part_01